MSVVPGFPTAKPEQISPVYWKLHTTHRDEAERVFSLGKILNAQACGRSPEPSCSC